MAQCNVYSFILKRATKRPNDAQVFDLVFQVCDTRVSSCRRTCFRWILSHIGMVTVRYVYLNL